MSFPTVLKNSDILQRGKNTERKTSRKGGNEFVSFGKLSPFWPKSKKQEEKNHFTQTKILNFKDSFYL